MWWFFNILTFKKWSLISLSMGERWSVWLISNEQRGSEDGWHRRLPRHCGSCPCCSVSYTNCTSLSGQKQMLCFRLPYGVSHMKRSEGFPKANIKWRAEACSSVPWVKLKLLASSYPESELGGGDFSPHRQLDYDLLKVHKTEPHS